jgi:hypothetical protein
MILRVFRARIKQGCRNEWIALVKEHSFPLLTGVPGLLGFFWRKCARPRRAQPSRRQGLVVELGDMPRRWQIARQVQSCSFSSPSIGILSSSLSHMSAV